MTIRKAKPEEWVDLKRLNQKLFIEGNDPTVDTTIPDKLEEYYKEATLKDNYCTLVYEENSEIKGYVISDIKKCESWRNVGLQVRIQNIYIDEAYRRQSIGMKFFKIIEEWAHNSGASELSVSTDAINSPALAFYKKNGFKEYEVTLKKPLK